MTRESILAVIAHWESAFAERDLQGLSALYADDAILESPIVGSISGREAVTKTTLALLEAFPDAKYTTEPPVIDGTRAAVAAVVEGTHVGAFLGVEPTGRPFRLSLVFLLEFRENEIVRDRRVYDFTGWLVQLGVLNAKPV
jgi:steroid delta-isomerase-like uncharacterized protein